jgi:hypothetical protein
MTNQTELYHSVRQFAAGVRRRDLPSQAIAEALKDGFAVTCSNNNENTISELLARLEAAERKHRE